MCSLIPNINSIIINLNFKPMRNVTRILTVLALFAVLAFVNGPRVMAQVPVLTESFENGGSIPAGWAVQQVSGTTAVTFKTTCTYPPITAAYNGQYFVNFNSWYVSSGQNRLRRTVALSTVGWTNTSVSFAWYQDPGYSSSCDYVQVQYSTNGTTWTNAGSQYCRYAPTAGWQLKTQALGAGADNQATLYVAFLFNSAYGNDCNLDLAKVLATPPPPPPAPVTIGTGTGTTSYPYYTFWSNAHSQFLYTAAEIAAAGGAAGNITALAFNVASNPGPLTLNQFKVTLIPTALTTLPTTFVTGGTTCYNPASYIVPGTGWQTLNFTTPFAWNGTSNIIVDVCWNNPVGWNSTSPVYATTLSGVEVGAYSDPTAGCTGLLTGTAQTSRANVQLTMPNVVGYLQGTITACYNSSPIVGATVAVGSLNTTTAAGGSYMLLNVPIGAQTVTVSAPGFVTNTFPVTVLANQMVTLNACLNPQPAAMQGIVKDAANNQPITGAKLIFKKGTDADIVTYTIAGGTYNVSIVPAGSGWKVTCQKAGFNDSVKDNMTFNAGSNNLDFNIWQTANPPTAPATAALNTGATAVNISWGQPTGFYEILYDNGVQTGYTIWATGNNLNGVKFTAPAYPAKIIGGKVNVGKTSNYPTPPPTRPPFKMYAYDATGPMGMPGAIIATSGDITPAATLGWCEFQFPTSVTVTSGNFYLVMKQIGNNPNAYGLAIDTANSQYRSVSQYATGQGPWVPAAGNFMMRAICQGQGGPLHITDRAFVSTEPVPGAIYETPLRQTSGYEGVGEVRGYDWANMLNNCSVTPMPASTKTGSTGPTVDLGEGYNGTLTGGKELDNTDVVLYNNGPLVNSAGTGTGGADESILQAGLTILGFGANNAAGIRMADNFTVAGSAWSVTSINFYSYQSNATYPPSTLTGCVVRIWNGQPGAAGATVVWGDLTTNRMGSTSYSNINRVSAPNGGTARRIMNVVANTPGLTLNPGTYWVEVGFTGSAASGPWAPPVTIQGTMATGNSVQTVDNGATWAPAMDGTYGQDIPFIVNGTTSGGGSGIPFLVWRLNQGQENTPTSWSGIPGTPTTQTTAVDNAWPSLPDGAYRWAIKAQYPGNRLSPPIFTNVIGKNWVTTVTVNINLTCYQIKPAYCAVRLVNTLVPDTNYLKVSDTTGIVVFNNVWKGNYNLTIQRMGFSPYQQNIDIFGPTTVNVTLIGAKMPPTGLVVNDRSLHATWHPPRAEMELINETWASGNFTANQWTVTGANWSVTSGLGNPAPSAMFYYSPTQAAGYHMYLTSKLLPATYAPMMNLKYDIYLDEFDPTTMNNLAVELWNGSTWTAVKTWESTNGSIPWTTDVLDIHTYSNNNFRFRFHAYGDGSYALNNWNLDNISVLATDGHTGPNPCVIGYNFYLNGIQSGFTTDTTYNIPPTQVVYGQTYQACVLAVYGSGYSPQICVNFTSHFLYPPREVAVTPVECSAYITWKKPQIPGSFDVLSITPRTEKPNANADYSNTEAVVRAIPPDNTDALWDVLFSYPANGAAVQTGIETNMTSSDVIYTTEWSGSNFWKYNPTNGTQTGSFTISGVTGIRDLATDWNGNFYGGANSSTLYKMNFTSATLIASINSAVPAIRHITYDPDANGNQGGFWTGGWGDMYLIKMDGTLTATGPATDGSSYGSAFDKWSNPGHSYVWINSQTGGSTFQQFEKTGATTLVSTGITHSNTGLPGFPSGGIAGGAGGGFFNGKFGLLGMAQPGSGTNSFMFCYEMGTGGGGGGTPPGLIGYNVYRNNILIHYVPSPDTLYYYDLNVDPGTHTWGVSAKYDLTSYGFPGTFGESLPAGNITMAIVCGLPLPFYEPWANGSFTFQNWTFSPSTQQHWVMNGSLGNPAPCADFKWDPPTNNYSLSLQSPTLNGGPWSCASIYFDFDYKCIDRNGGETEKLTAEVYYNGSWHNVADIKNNGTTNNWVHKHLDITSAKGKGFKVRFRANGESSANILHWYVDNIYVYGVCNKPLNLTSVQHHDTVDLAWNAPTCAAGEVVDLIFDDGTYEGQVYVTGGTGYVGNVFPVGPTMSGKLIQFSAMFQMADGSTNKILIYDAAHNLLATTAPMTPVADQWVTVNVDSVPFTGQFYAMVEMDGSQTNLIALDQNGPFAPSDLCWTILPPTWALLSSYGFPKSVALLRAKAYIPFDLKSAVVAPNTQQTSPAQKPSDRLKVTSIHGGEFFGGAQGVYANTLDGSIVDGYNVYRTNNTGDTATFAKLNAQTVTVKNYKDVIGNTVANYGTYKYSVTALYRDTVANAILCESPYSNIITIKFPAVGIVEVGNGQISVYPNPASENVNVSSDYTISSIEVMNYVGQTVYRNNAVAAKTTKFNVSNLQAGVYFVKVSTEQGTRTVKITVTR
jgi:hypothetical protein